MYAIMSILMSSSDTAIAQVGSYTHLAAWGAGFTTLLSAVTSLANAVGSTTTLLQFQEHTFAAPGNFRAGSSARTFKQKGLDFSYGSIQGATRITRGACCDGRFDYSYFHSSAQHTYCYRSAPGNVRTHILCFFYHPGRGLVGPAAMVNS